MALEKDKCRVFTTVSGKGGAGKSTVSCMLGVAWARMGLRTLLIDADEGLRCLDLMLGVDGEVAFDLGDVLAGRCEAADAIRPVPAAKGLFLLPAPHSAGQIGEGLGPLVAALRPEYDRILIDSSAGIGPGFRAASAVSDEVLAVVGCDPVSIRDARQVCELLRDITDSPRRMILNRFDYDAASRDLIPHVDAIIDATAMRLGGIVPYAPVLARGFLRATPATRGHAWRAFVRIAHRLEGKNIRLPKLKRI